MNTNFSEQGDEAPTIEVRVYRDGELISRELCESEDEASLIVDTWTELEGVTCEVDDLSAGSHYPDEILEAPLTTGPEADYP